MAKANSSMNIHRADKIVIHEHERVDGSVWRTIDITGETFKFSLTVFAADDNVKLEVHHE